MITKVVFETSTFADAVKKASAVAPSSGAAYDEAGGILIEVDPAMPDLVVMRSTNMDIFRTEWVGVLSIEGAAARWRVPSGVIQQLANSLPIGTGKEVTLEEREHGSQTRLSVTSGRTKARVNLLASDYYPEWDSFDPEDLVTVTDMGAKVGFVEWAAAKNDSPPISGVHFNGEEVLATDRYRLAVAGLVIPNMPDPVTVPAGLLGSILKQTGDVKVGFSTTQMLVMPDETTQIRAVLYGQEYPGVHRLMRRDHPDSVVVRKAQLIELINRVIIAAEGDRMPTVHLFLGDEEFSAMAQGQDDNAISDVFAIEGQAKHDRIEIKFTPKNLLDALNKAPQDLVTLGYDCSKPAGHLYVQGGGGFECWVVTRADTSN